MAITASLVKELRERTGAPMMDCKALTEANGDIDAAIEAMRTSGQAKAVKKAGRVTAEGIVTMAEADDGKKAVLLEINSETDFVARDDNFIAFAGKAINTALATSANDTEALLKETIGEESQTVEEARQALVAKVGENIQVRRVACMTSEGKVGSYLHGTKIGVLVALDSADDELAKDIAMHIAASKPEVISPKEVDQARIDEEKRILMDQAKESGKPEDVVEKMVTGRLNKFLSEISLLGQPFVKDPSLTVGKLLEQRKATVSAFVRYEVGEGIEKEEQDFRKEVMAQVQGSE